MLTSACRMWRTNEQTGNTTLIPLPPLRPLGGTEPSKIRKRLKQLRWVNNADSLTDSPDVSQEILARLRCHGVLP
jgi:hypothetical protein